MGLLPNIREYPVALLIAQLDCNSLSLILILVACIGIPDKRLQPEAQQRQLLVSLCQRIRRMEVGRLRVRHSE